LQAPEAPSSSYHKLDTRVTVASSRALICKENEMYESILQ
jgi:hypothetical protein